MVNVTNRIVPSMQVLVIGAEKIIAYNTSSGIFSHIEWFADDKKISENKDYIVYSLEDGGKFPANIRIDVSNGEDKQSITVPVERSPQNRVALKKIGRPLVILTNTDNNSIAPAPDDIIWSDALKPLFFYLGESDETTQYFVIDNDVDVDTDLS